MIDYQRHRRFLVKTESGNWTSSDTAHLIQDAAELLDKAEKWDKVNEGLTVDGIHTSKGILGELYELREKVDEQDKAMGLVAKLTIISMGADERIKKYWLALEKLSYKCSDGWSGDDCAEYAREAIKDFAPVEEGKK